jgi:hypothetical protein
VAHAITILHVSDIHLHDGGRDAHQILPGVSPAPVDVADSLFVWLRDTLRTNSQRTVGVLSGDLSLLGADRDISYARTRWNASVPANSGTYVLGNHDFWDDSVSRTVFLAPRTHKRIRAAHWPPPGDHFQVDCGSLRVRFYLLDTTPSSIRGMPRNILARGDYPAIDIKHNSALIAAHRSADRTEGLASLSVAVMHHPIATIRRRDAFREWLRLNGIGLVLAGHTHEKDVLPRGDKQVVCPSSTISDPPGLMVHEIDWGGGDAAAVRTTVVELRNGRFQAVEPVYSYTVFVA